MDRIFQHAIDKVKLLEAERDQLRARNAELEAEVERLHKYIREMGAIYG